MFSVDRKKLLRDPKNLYRAKTIEKHLNNRTR